MRLGLFSAVFGALMLIITLVVPVPLWPTVPAGGVPYLLPESRCLELTYEAGRGDWMPSAVRLRPDTARLNGLLGTRRWYRAEATYARWSGDAWWRYAGADSIDVAWHHSPVLRLPAGGDTLVGRALPVSLVPLFFAMLEGRGLLREREFAVRAVRVRCT